ncbi:hypothetical protein D3C74_420320 [compost metagenome]
MADIGFYRTHTAELLLGGERLKSIDDRIQFDRISQDGSRPVSLDITDRFGVDLRLLPYLFQQLFLRFPIRCGDAFGKAVVVDSAAFDDGVNHILICDRLGQRLQ